MPDEVTTRWIVGTPPRQWARQGSSPLREVMIIGVCGATDAEVRQLAQCGVSDDVVRRWPGSYVVVEQAGDAVTIWTDLAAAVPVYVAAADDGVYWSTSARSLVGLKGSGVNLERVAAELLSPGTPMLAGSQTYFEGIDLLPGGHRIHISCDGTIRSARVWSPTAQPGHEPSSLRDELDAAVGVRVDEPAGDLTYALAAAQHRRVRQHMLPLEPGHLPYGGLTQLPVTDEPAPSTVAYARFAHQLDTMVATVVTSAHLTGDGGDSLLTTPDVWIADLLATHHYPAAFDEAVRLGRVRRSSPATLLRQAVELNRTEPRRALLDWADLARGRSVPRIRAKRAISLLSDPRLAGWATAAAAGGAAELAERGSDQSGLAAPRGARAVWDVVEQMTEVGRTAHADVQLAHAHGVELHNPFTDSRVIDTYLAMTTGRMPSPAAFKPVLRTAMRGVLPSALLARTTKGIYAPDFHLGLRVHRDALSELIDGFLAAAGLIDAARLVGALERAASGIDAGIWLLDAALSVEAWLRAHHAAALPGWKAVTTAVRP